MNGTCLGCPSGHWCGAENLVTLLAQTQARFQNNTLDDRYFMYGAAAHACQPGTFQPLGSSISCLECPAGRASSGSSAIGCDVCAAGRSTMGRAGQSTCSDCEAGTSTLGLTGFATCLACDPGRFAERNGTQQCEACMLGGVSYATHCECPPDTYFVTVDDVWRFSDNSPTRALLVNNSDVAKTGLCERCPEHAQVSPPYFLLFFSSFFSLFLFFFIVHTVLHFLFASTSLLFVFFFDSLLLPIVVFFLHVVCLA